MKRKKFIKLASTGAFGISSLGYLSCDYKKEIFGSYFDIKSPNATSSCGCGESVGF